MQPNRVSYNLRPVKKDTIYNLLPFVIRSNDPRSAIQAYMEAVADQHNYYLSKLDQLPGLQDPTQAGLFSPASFGESPTDYATYVALSTSTTPLTTDQQNQLATLKTNLPKSVAAGAFEKVVLSLLSSVVGADLHGRYDSAANRQLISTAVLRHHIKGTQGSVYILGRILGFLDLKVQELWTRFAIKDPAYPNAEKNDIDFSATPDEYPYWPRNKNNTYDGIITTTDDRTDGSLIASGTPFYTANETFQVPQGTASYDPSILDDGPIQYVVTFNSLVTDATSEGYWTTAVNNHNPFGNFLTEVTSRPVLGSYTLSGGDFINPAQVTIPFQGGSGSVVFQAIAPGEWANGIEMMLTADSGGTSRLQLTGPQSKIKFKSSYFDLSLASDILIFPTLFPPVPVTGNDSGSLDDIAVESNTVVNITAASGTFIDAQNPLLTLSTVDGITVGSIVKVSGIPSLNGHRTVVEVDPEIPGIVVQAYPGALTKNSAPSSVPALNATTTVVLVDASWCQTGLSIAFDGFGDYLITGVSGTTVTFKNIGDATKAPSTVIPTNTVVTGPSVGMTYANDFNIVNTPKVSYGRLAGDLPVTGQANGTRIVADPSQTIINFQLYLELIATLRDLFETIRPITRTPRNERYGFLLRDSMLYAPILTNSTVTLASSPSGNLYTLSVDKNGTVSWQPTNTGSPDTIIQTDNANQSNYQWTLVDAGDSTQFVAQVVSPSVTAVTTNIVYVQQAAFTGFVYLQNQLLVASATSPEVAVNSIHGDGTLDESGALATNKPLVHEDLSSLADFLSDDAVVPNTPENNPAPNFVFQTAPEDDLSITLLATESIRTFWAANYKEISDPDFADDNSVWNYDFNGTFIGRDVRLRATGGDPGVVEPVPTGDTGRTDGIFYNYPVEYLDYSGHYLWRSRNTNVLYDTYYTYDAPNVNVGGTRVDTSISQDGQIEGATTFNNGATVISSRGFGPTPNNQAWTSPHLDHLWDTLADRTVTCCSTTFSAASSNGSFTDILVANTGDLQPGSIIKISGSAHYNGTWELRGVNSTTKKLTIPTAFVATDTGSIWVRLVDMQVWGATTLTVGLQIGPASLSTDGIHYRVFVNTTQVLTGKMGFDPADTVNLTGCATTKGSTTVLCASTTGLVVGMTVTGTNVPLNSTISSITDSTHFVISLPASDNGSGNAFVARFAPITLVFDNTSAIAPAGALVYIEMQGSGEWEATLTNTSTPALVSGDGITNGSLLNGGGSRDALEVTVLPTGGTTHFGDFCVDNSNFATINSVPSWRGGAWSGTSSYTVTDRTAQGLPGLLHKSNDGTFPS